MNPIPFDMNQTGSFMVSIVLSFEKQTSKTRSHQNTLNLIF